VRLGEYPSLLTLTVPAFEGGGSTPYVDFRSAPAEVLR
jgi:hypothetical protein